MRPVQGRDAAMPGPAAARVSKRRGGFSVISFNPFERPMVRRVLLLGSDRRPSTFGSTTQRSQIAMSERHVPPRCPECGHSNKVVCQRHPLHPVREEFDYFECYGCGHAWRGAEQHPVGPEHHDPRR